MKTTRILFVVVLLALGSCRQEPQKVSSPKTETSPDSEKRLDVPWMAVYNERTEQLELRKNPVADSHNLTVQDMIDALNLKYPQIHLEWVSQQGNTAIVKIEDADYLTEQSGSAGAQAYLAEATFSITEVQPFTAVDFRFKEGDHASPGIFNRQSFQSFN